MARHYAEIPDEFEFGLDYNEVQAIHSVMQFCYGETERDEEVLNGVRAAFEECMTRHKLGNFCDGGRVKTTGEIKLEGFEILPCSG